MDSSTLYLILACLFGFLMAYGVGANDVANAMGTSVGAKVLTLRQAVLVAAIFEVAGALLVGQEVTDTLRDRLLVMDHVQASHDLLILGMLAASLSAGLWLLLATYLGWPVSTTHSIVGAISGFGIFYLGYQAVAWSTIGQILLGWLLSPVIAGMVAFTLFSLVQKYILNHAQPLLQAKRQVPCYIALITFMISIISYKSLLKHTSLPIAPTLCAGITACIAAAVGMWCLQRIEQPQDMTQTAQYQAIEQVFAVLMIFTACAMAFAHGSNDVANAIGPIAAIVDWLGYNGQSTGIPLWLLLLGAVGIVVGLITYGYRIIQTIGDHITELTPSRGFAAELSAATTVVMASYMGLPVSTTQTLVGSILGVGLARGIGALNLQVIRRIFMSWVVTLPAGAVLTLLLFFVLRFLTSCICI